VIKANSVLWGGLFNGIAVRRSNISDLEWTTQLGRHVAMFEPDYIVKCDDSDADRNRGELHFSQFLDANPRHGIGMTEVYNEAYEKEYKFQRKRPV
jgi:hypothetical protein